MPLYSWLLSSDHWKLPLPDPFHHLNWLVVHGVPTPDVSFANVYNLALGHTEFHLPSIGPSADFV